MALGYMTAARVASVHFAPVAADRSIYNGKFHMPAVPLGASPHVIEISDHVQREEGPYTLGDGRGRLKRENRITADEIVRDIVREWTSTGLGMTPECRPGIWVVRDRVPVFEEDPHSGDRVIKTDVMGFQVFRAATPEEAEEMWQEDLFNAQAADRAYAEWCFMDGNKIASDVRLIRFIPPSYKLGARKYGLNAEWAKEGAAFEVTNCTMCKKVIGKNTVICPHCQAVNDMGAYAIHVATKEAAVAVQVERIKAEMIAKAQLAAEAASQPVPGAVVAGAQQPAGKQKLPA